MTTGVSAAIVITIGGTTASTPGQELDLLTDAAGDLLLADAAGDVLLAVPGVSWSGTTASEGLGVLGGTAAILVLDRHERVDSEGWAWLATETGSPIVTEGT